MFEIEIPVRLEDTDAAGVVFFANFFRIAHRAFEAFMESLGYGIDRMIREGDYLLPIVHAEADYKKSVLLGERLAVSMAVEVKKSSFVVSYRFKKADGEVVAELATVHVAVDKTDGKKRPLPEGLQKGLETIS